MTGKTETYDRQSTRLRHYDYAHPGAYFVTICTHSRQTLFAEISDETVRESRIGRIVRAYWTAIPQHFPFIAHDAFGIMPNHIHGILIITEYASVGAQQLLRPLGIIGDSAFREIVSSIIR